MAKFILWAPRVLALLIAAFVVLDGIRQLHRRGSGRSAG